MDISFDHGYRDDLAMYEVVPRVDGVPLTELIERFEVGMNPAGDAYGGLPSRAFRFDETDNHFHGRPTAEKIPLLGCSCGEWGCWPLMARVITGPDVVLWDLFEQPFRPERDYSDFGPFDFPRPEYDTALRDLSRAIATEHR